MKFEINKNEWYPVYDICDIRKGSVSTNYEIPDDLFKKYKSALKNFNKIQDELEKIYMSGG